MASLFHTASIVPVSILHLILILQTVFKETLVKLEIVDTYAQT